MNTEDFNLSTDDWIDVSWVSPAADKPARVGLRELLTRAGEIADVHAPLAPAASGLMRVLTVLTAQITGLDHIPSAREWSQRREALLCEQPACFADAALDRVFGDSGAFALFDRERPFLQDPRLSEECSKSTGVNKFVWTRIAGANQVFLSHDIDSDQQPIPADEAVWHLLSWLYYGTSGRSTARTVDGSTEANTGAGPLRRTLSVHPWGANLYETLLLNQVYVPPEAGIDLALWQETELNNPLGEPPPISGIARLLAGRFRHAALLVPGTEDSAIVDAYITWAWRQPHPPADDPYVAYQVNKKGDRFPLYAKADRAIWRDLDSLILERPAGESDNRPAVLTQLSSLPAALLERLRVKAFGYDQDGQTRDKAYFQAATPPILGMLKDGSAAEKVAQAHRAANDTGESLRTALRAAWVELYGKPKVAPVWLDKAMTCYWGRAGDRFWSIVDSSEPLPQLPNEFIRLAVTAYELATDAYAHTPKTITTIEKHRSRLFRGWKKDTSHDRRHDETRAQGESDTGDHMADAGREEFDW